MKTVKLHKLPNKTRADVTYHLFPSKKQGATYYEERTDRNIGWITQGEQSMLGRKVVGIAGCGGMGGHLGERFLRLGIGEIRIADCELFDVSNINRQFAAAKATVGKSKAIETARMLREISDDFKLIVYPQGICPEIVEGFVLNCDAICDEIEFWAAGSRILLHQIARKYGVPVFNCNTVGFGTRLFLFQPNGKTMEDCLGLDYEEAFRLQKKIQSGRASATEIKNLMGRVLRGLIPELPEYCAKNSPWKNIETCLQRLINETRASIIATNPVMATGFLANHVLLHLLQNFGEINRDFVKPPEIPGYLYFDAAKMDARVVEKENVQHE